MAEERSSSYICAEDISVGYHNLPLIQKINLHVNRGEILTLIGPNGAGKSTILKSLIGQLKLVKGAVWLDGTSMGTMKEKEIALRMSVMMTGRVKTERMTCEEVVSMGRYPYTGKMGILTEKDWQIVRESLELVQGLELAEKDFEAVSDGQRQRVLLARAICQEPEIIVLDEPTSFLDVRYKLELLSILRDMAKKKKITVIMSLHEIDLAEKIADKIICVKGDHIAHYGKPETIFKEDTIRELYGIDNGYFDPVFGSLELPRPEGEPEVLVISSGGTGIPVFRSLQKKNIPFAAGILYTNDIDYQLAKLLAVHAVIEKPFEEISDRALKEAMALVESCKRVINAGVTIGTGNKKIAEVLKKASGLGKLETAQDGNI